MALTYVHSSIFNSPAQTLVNTVNTVGIMGKGIAKEFKSAYPRMFSEYKSLCSSRSLNIGDLHLWKSDKRWVLNFPTKTTWRLPSKLEYVDAGLTTFVKNYKSMGIISISFPPLGCGNGNLDWNEVRPLMVARLGALDIPVYIHDVQVNSSFVPEHHEASGPETFERFLDDIRRAINNRPSYETTEARRQYHLTLLLDNSLQVRHVTGKTEVIPAEEIESAWLRLKEGILSIDRYSDDRSRRYKSYIFPLLSSLPYVKSVSVRREGQPESIKSQGLFLDRATFGVYKPATAISEDDQRWLFP